MHSKLLLLFFLFINIYFPISPYLVLFVDIVLLMIYRKRLNFTSISPFIIIPFLLLILASFGYLMAGDDGELFIVFKYLRTLVSTYVIIQVSANINIEPKVFLRCLCFVLVLHMVAIVAQTLYPPLSMMMAPYFNFARDEDFLLSISVRKLGLTGGFDLASMLLVSSVSLFYQQFFSTKKVVYLILAIIALALTLTVSRFGMVIGALVVAYYAVISFTKSGFVRLSGIFLSAIGGVIVVLIIIPILASTNGLLFDIGISSSVDISYFLQDYSSASGTLDALTNPDSDHLGVYRELDFFQFLFGAGNSSNSDIGYIQFLFQVGLVGILLLFVFYIIILKRIKRVKAEDDSLNALKLFLLVYIGLLFVFNYKIQILYSRGFHELMIICYVYLISWNKKLYIISQRNI